MATLLRIGERHDWTATYENLATQIAVDPQETASRILASYGGMGSLNDVVLQRNGKPLLDENEQFDALRIRLHMLCSKLLRGD
ncbi:DUF6966 domain-containing protein [Pseudoduganella ginsengisoli]|uniref:DUF6966 domain-containing protein n=1 Tax=Pseudoduganella ginsengisoli TaxID=1462440 RepID=UPI0035307039